MEPQRRAVRSAIGTLQDPLARRSTLPTVFHFFVIVLRPLGARDGPRACFGWQTCDPADRSTCLSPSTDCQWCRQMTVVAVKWSPNNSVPCRLQAARVAAGCVLLCCAVQCRVAAACQMVNAAGAVRRGSCSRGHDFCVERMSGTAVAYLALSPWRLAI